MRALKALVAGMGVLIVLALCVLGYGLYKKSVDPNWKLFNMSGGGTASKSPQTPAPAMLAPAPADAATAAFGTVPLGLADGCRIMDAQADGGRALLRIGPDAPCDAVIVVDTRDGRVLGRFKGH